MKQASYPSIKNAGEIHFKLNSDDFTKQDIRKISKYLKDKGICYKYYRQYSNIKLMSWGIYKISTNENITFSINEIRTKQILNAVFPEWSEPIGIGSALLNDISRDNLNYAFKVPLNDQE